MSTGTLPEQQVSTPQPKQPPHDREMTLLEHLDELRRRLVICSLAIMLGLAIAAVPVPGYSSLAWALIGLVVAPAAGSVQAIKPGETLFTYFQVALLVGAAFAMPVIIYQVIAFIMPALYPREQKLLLLAVPGVMVSFLLGVTFGYFALVPFAVRFLLGFGAELVPPNWSFGEYVGTVTMLLFWMGVAFELPLVMFALATLGVVDARRLAGLRKWAIVLAFVVGAVITPTPDPFNQALVALPLYMLFEIGILLARLARPVARKQ
ncbi:MAG: twin-arginine translocase subunit TatC [Chloroflexi bacterium]|nr:twin-arginine translocase subunit TatC [Chloroflexota bacterium]